jgi:amidophosphoribosyltransferase
MNSLVLKRDRWGENCGLFGIFGHKDASKLTYFGLFALQHRGQESAGIVCSNWVDFSVYRGMGLVAEVFNEEVLGRLDGELAIGHVRYSTSGERIGNIQPLVVKYARGPLAIAHNGNLINALSLREKLEREGSIFQTTVDSEVIIHLIARSKKRRFTDAIIEALEPLKGAYSLLLMTPERLIGIRDPWGFRPLCLGKLQNAYIITSESCALDLVGGRFIREIEPGEMVIITKDGIREKKVLSAERRSMCIFELIYFARPDSNLFGGNMHLMRMKMGSILAEEQAVSADLIVPIPDSGLSASMGYAQASGIPYAWGFVRNRYIGRTFISPSRMLRDIGVKIKLNPIGDVVRGKRIVVIDDSIVRGTTCRKIIKLLRRAGAKEVHLRIASPPIRYPCFFGIDTPTRKELIAATHSLEEIRRYIRVDTLGYLSIEGMLKAVNKAGNEFCTACFDGNYPIAWE